MCARLCVSQQRLAPSVTPPRPGALAGPRRPPAPRTHLALHLHGAEAPAARGPAVRPAHAAGGPVSPLFPPPRAPAGRRVGSSRPEAGQPTARATAAAPPTAAAATPPPSRRGRGHGGSWHLPPRQPGGHPREGGLSARLLHRACAARRGRAPAAPEHARWPQADGAAHLRRSAGFQDGGRRPAEGEEVEGPQRYEEVRRFFFYFSSAQVPRQPLLWNGRV